MATDSARDIGALVRGRMGPQGSTRYGVVIGVESHLDSRLDLNFAAADARAMHALMIDPACGMFPEENVHLLLNEAATRERLRRELASLRRRVGPDDTVWIYYAGHAAPEGQQVYWVPYDADVDDLYATGLGQHEIASVIDEVRAQRLLMFLDCCHAAATAAQSNRTRQVLRAADVLSSFRGFGRLTLASSDGAEKSVELSEEGHGAFTWFLERGLRGEADKNGDGVVTLDELWAFLRTEVESASARVGKKQTPVLIGDQRHDFALSINPIVLGGLQVLAGAIEDRVGMKTGQLTTDEGILCLDLLRFGPRTDEERVLLAGLKSFVEDMTPVGLLRHLIDAVKRARIRAPLPYAEPARDAAIPEESDARTEAPIARQDVSAWAEILVFEPDPLVVTDAVTRRAMLATGWPWRVLVKQLGIVMLLIPPGVFLMGSPNSEEGRGEDEGLREHGIGKPFYLSETVVTQRQWGSLLGYHNSRFVGPERPVENVSWVDCQDFAKTAGRALRLPSEAEWEYAARASSKTPFWYGAALPSELANYDGNFPYAKGPKGPFRGHTVDAAELGRNGWGLYQMHGNVWEWCEAEITPTPTGGTKRAGRVDVHRVVRGGSWKSAAVNCRSARRLTFDPALRRPDFGLRLARTAEQDSRSEPAKSSNRTA